MLRSVVEGLRFVRGEQALLGSFAIDLLAMTFGMPRALFPVLSVSVYGAGATGTGLLYAAVSAGATVAALTAGWIENLQLTPYIAVNCKWNVVTQPNASRRRQHRHASRTACEPPLLLGFPALAAYWADEKQP